MGLRMGQRRAVPKLTATPSQAGEPGGKGKILDKLCTNGWHQQPPP